MRACNVETSCTARLRLLRRIRDASCVAIRALPESLTLLDNRRVLGWLILVRCASRLIRRDEPSALPPFASASPTHCCIRSHPSSHLVMRRAQGRSRSPTRPHRVDHVTVDSRPRCINITAYVSATRASVFLRSSFDDRRHTGQKCVSGSQIALEFSCCMTTDKKALSQS